MTVAMEHTKDEAKFFILVLWCTCQHVSAKIYLPCSSWWLCSTKKLDLFSLYYIYDVNTLSSAQLSHL